jgi:hypothetical protein
MRGFGILAMVAAAALGAQAQSGSFVVSQNGKQVGTASFRFTRTAAGFDSTALVKVEMKGLNYAISKDEKLSPASALEHVQLNAVVNGAAVNVIATANPSGLLMNTSANGRSQTQRLAVHPAAVFLPDFDPGALETLLALAVEHNNRDLWVILPKGTGSVEAVQLTTYADEQGTLDGKPVVVHHLLASFAGVSADLFSGSKNQLLQAELPQQGFSLTRVGFRLKQPAKPGAPPAEATGQTAQPTAQ